MKEHHRELINELTRVGLSPRLRPTSGGHMRVEWETGGKVHHIVTASTPSDRRSTLNARALIRRQLRDQGFYKSPERGPLLEKNGFSDLEHRVPTIEDRVATLELDVVTLLDMIAAKESFEAGWQAAADAVRKTLTAPPQVQVPEKSVTQTDKPKFKHELLFFIPCDQWSHADQIARQSRKSVNAVRVALNSLKNKGLVEHDKVNHLYRKKIEALL